MKVLTYEMFKNAIPYYEIPLLLLRILLRAKIFASNWKALTFQSLLRNHTYHSITVTCQRSHSISNQTNLKTINFQPYATTSTTVPCNNDYSNVTFLRTATVTAFLSVLRWFSSEFCFQATCLSSYHLTHLITVAHKIKVRKMVMSCVVFTSRMLCALERKQYLNNVT